MQDSATGEPLGLDVAVPILRAWAERAEARIRSLLATPGVADAVEADRRRRQPEIGSPID